jgi:hypothetical protein
MAKKTYTKSEFLKLIAEGVKKALYEGQIETAPVKTPVKTPDKPAPLKKPGITIPQPGTFPKPKPKAKNEGQTETAPVKTPVKTPDKPAPLKKPGITIPQPGTFPKPKPKAKSALNENTQDFFELLNKQLNIQKERSKMQRLLMEAPMNIEPGGHRPDSSIQRSIEGQGENPFNAIELFNKRVLDQSVLEKIGSEEFNHIVNNLREVGEMNVTEVMNAVRLLQTIEEPSRAALEQLAKNVVKSRFGISDEIMGMIDVKLKDAGTISPPEDNDIQQPSQQRNQNRQPSQQRNQNRPQQNNNQNNPNSPNNPLEQAAQEFTPEEQEVIKKHSDKRVINNALMMGAGFRAHQILDDIKASLDAINRRLYPLYKKIMPNVEIYMWKTSVESLARVRIIWGKAELEHPEEEQNDEENDEQNNEQDNEQNDEQNDEQDNEQETPNPIRVKAEAVMFPILLHETSKAVIELLLLNHLAEVQQKYGEAVAKEVVNKSDSYYNEHWMKLIGPRLWKYLHDALIYVVHEENDDHTIIPFILNRISSMEPEDFMSLIEDSIYKGPRAIRKIKMILAKIKQDIEDYENQNQEVPTPEEISPEDNSVELANILKHSNIGAAGDTQQTTQVVNQNKSIQEMSLPELNDLLDNALEDENYELAGQIRDEINGRLN